MAPGSLVLSAWIPDLEVVEIWPSLFCFSDFNLLYRTSATCFHVSGVAALLKGAHSEWSPTAIRSAIMKTANPRDNTFGRIKDYGHDLQFASPLAMGAGQIDPNRALDPGLIYDATPQDYANFLCHANLTDKQILTITRSDQYNCSESFLDLNYPSFIALYGHDHVELMEQKYRRILTNINAEGAVSTYKAIVTTPKGSEVLVSPKSLIFRQQYEKQSYTLTIKYRGNKDQKVFSGSLIWVQKNGKHSLRSLIVVSPMIFA